MQYRNIQNENDYLSLLNSGMFFEFHPELKGNWHEDKLVILEEELNNLKERFIGEPMNFHLIQTIKNHLREINSRYSVGLMATYQGQNIIIQEKPDVISFKGF